MEASRGDPDAASRRLDAIREIPILSVSDEALGFAEKLMHQLRLPKKAAEDALHIALATVAELDYLISWNCRHIAHAHIAHDAFTFAQTQGYAGTLICTPQALIEDYDEY